MGEIVTELYTLKATVGEIAKAIYKAGEANFSGVPVIILRDEDDKKKIQKAMKDAVKKYEFIDERELNEDSPTIFRHIIVFSDVIPTERFTVIYVQNGEFPERVLKAEEE